MEQNLRTQLRQSLTTHFDVEELRTLCYDLGVDYDDLRGEGRTNKARDLVTYMERRGRLSELIETCSRRRPHVSWQGWTVVSGARQQAGYSRPVGQGLIALAELMELPQVRTAVVSFRTDFEAACQQTNVLADYKHLHDLLHTLQFHCYNPILQDAQRFPDDDVAVDNLMDYELTLQQIVSDLQDAVARASFAATGTAWIQDLVKARETLASAVEGLDARQLKRAIWLLNRVLAVQPSQINTRLNMAARALRLSALVEAMTFLSDNLERADLNPEQVGRFEAGVDALVSLNDNLAAFVEEHDRWQAVDMELRRIGANMRHDLFELEMSWPDLKVRAESLYGGSGEKWAVSFQADSHHLDEAIAAENPARIKRYFRRFLRHAGTRFYRVDVGLKRLCEDLRKVGEPLTEVMRMIE
ncbi:MAG: hypothetical protein PVF45_04480 [Anaerolineae bacterium]